MTKVLQNLGKCTWNKCQIQKTIDEDKCSGLKYFTKRFCFQMNKSSTFTFIHLADAFIQRDLQIRIQEAEAINPLY